MHSKIRIVRLGALHYLIGCAFGREVRGRSELSMRDLTQGAQGAVGFLGRIEAALLAFGDDFGFAAYQATVGQLASGFCGFLQFGHVRRTTTSGFVFVVRADKGVIERFALGGASGRGCFFNFSQAVVVCPNISVAEEVLDGVHDGFSGLLLGGIGRGVAGADAGADGVQFCANFIPFLRGQCGYDLAGRSLGAPFAQFRPDLLLKPHGVFGLHYALSGAAGFEFFHIGRSGLISFLAFHNRGERRAHNGQNDQQGFHFCLK